MKQTSKHFEAGTLRQRAESLLKQKLQESSLPPSESDILKLNHELQVHQIELEILNQELLLAKEQAEASADTYTKLYDFAPSGYFTLSREGRIIEMNLHGSEMLGKVRSELKKCLFGHFLTQDTKSTFNLFLEKVFNSRSNESCEVTLNTAGNMPMHIYLTGRIDENTEQCMVTVVDITVRRQTEDSLHISNTKYQTLFDLLPIGITISDSSGKIIETNKIAESLLGLSRKEQQDRNIQGEDWQIIRSDGSIMPASEYASVRALQEKLQVENVEMGIVKHKDQITWLNVSAVPVPLEGYGVAIVYNDISLRRHAEHALHASEGKYRKDFMFQRSILENPINIIIFALDKNYCYTAFTKHHQETIKKIWGVDIHIGLNMLNVISDPEDRQKAKANFDRALQGECFILTEEYGDDKLYRTYYEDYYSSIKESDGSVVGVSVFVIDVTLRFQAQAALKEAEWKFRALFEKGPIGVAYHKMIYDNSGRPVDYYFIDANERYQELTGVDPRGKTVKQAFPGIENDSFNWIETFGHVARTGEQVHFEQYLQANNRWYDCVGYQYKPDHFVAAFIEITERKLTEKKLFSQTMLLEAQINSTIDGILVIDKNQKRILINRRMIELFNIPAEIAEDEDDNKLLEYVTGLTKYPEQFLEKVIYLYDHDGLESRDEIELNNGMVFDRYSAPVIGMDGKNYGRIWNFRDMTQRKAAQDAIKEREERFRAITKSAKDAIITINSQGRIVDCNQSAEIMFGYSTQEISGKDLTLLIPQPLVELHKNGIKRIVEGEESHDIRQTTELHGLHKNGIEFPVELSLASWETGSGKYFTGIIRDITERKKADIQISKLLRAVEQSPASIMITNLAGDIEYVNPKFSAITGYSFEEALGKNPRILKSDETKSENYKELWETITSGKQWRGEFLNKKKNGELFSERASISPVLNEIGKITHFIAIKEDIGEEKLLISNLMIAKEKAEESDRLKSAFLANLSHEIRTPMNGIQGFARLLKDPQLTGEEQQEYIRVIEKSGNRMLNIIHALVDISKIESGQMEVSLSNANMNEHIEYAYKLFKIKSEDKGVNILITKSLLAEEVVFRTDTLKLDSILINLVDNAIKFTNEGSIEIGYTTKGRYFEVFVKDTGIGIPKNRQEAIFERFIQADISNNQAYDGAGLGLSIAKAYVEMLGGKIWVESEEGQGSAFYFTIPYLAEEQVQINIPNVFPSEAESGQIKNLKILIAEDDEASDLLLTTLLKKNSHEIIHTATGAETIEICRNNPGLDLILMDIRMPDMDGYNATRQIRDFNKHVIIIAQTAHGLVGDRKKAIKAGCNDYIPKPIDEHELLRLIQKYFGK